MMTGPSFLMFLWSYEAENNTKPGPVNSKITHDRIPYGTVILNVFQINETDLINEIQWLYIILSARYCQVICAQTAMEKIK